MGSPEERWRLAAWLLFPCLFVSFIGWMLAACRWHRHRAAPSAEKTRHFPPLRSFSAQYSALLLVALPIAIVTTIVLFGGAASGANAGSFVLAVAAGFAQVICVTVLLLVLVAESFARSSAATPRCRLGSVLLVALLLVVLVLGNCLVAFAHPGVRRNSGVGLYKALEEPPECSNFLEVRAYGHPCVIETQTRHLYFLLVTVQVWVLFTARQGAAFALLGFACWYGVVAGLGRVPLARGGEEVVVLFEELFTLAVLLLTKRSLELEPPPGPGGPGRPLEPEAALEEGRPEHLQDPPDPSDKVVVGPEDYGVSDNHHPFLRDLMDRGIAPGDGDAFTDLVELGFAEQWLQMPDTLSLNINDPNAVLGSGSFGSVVRGLWHGTLVAVKLPTQTRTRSVAGLQTLLNELRVLRHLRHPNIATCFGACVWPESCGLALILEFVQGDVLDAFVSNNIAANTLSDGTRVCVVKGVCHGLRYLHNRIPAIVHGDLKPSNIMVESHASQPRAKILDFGLSRVLTGEAKQLGGTLLWMAPELLERYTAGGAEEVKPAPSADLFSFGLIVRYIAIGKRHKMVTKGNGAYKHQLVSPPSDFSPALASVIAAATPMLDKVPDGRPCVAEFEEQMRCRLQSGGFCEDEEVSGDPEVSSSSFSQVRVATGIQDAWRQEHAYDMQVVTNIRDKLQSFLARTTELVEAPCSSVCCHSHAFFETMLDEFVEVLQQMYENMAKVERQLDSSGPLAGHDQMDLIQSALNASRDSIVRSRSISASL